MKVTEKELLYVEDAIGHEQNIISICNESLNFISDTTLVTFMESEIKKHESLLKKLLNKLEECAK